MQQYCAYCGNVTDNPNLTCGPCAALLNGPMADAHRVYRWLCDHDRLHRGSLASPGGRPQMTFVGRHWHDLYESGDGEVSVEYGVRIYADRLRLAYFAGDEVFEYDPPLPLPATEAEFVRMRYAIHDRLDASAEEAFVDGWRTCRDCGNLVHVDDMPCAHNASRCDLCGGFAADHFPPDVPTDCVFCSPECRDRWLSEHVKA